MKIIKMINLIYKLKKIKYKFNNKYLQKIINNK